MKARWLALVARIDALSERERIMVFAAAAALVVFGLNAVFLAPLRQKEALLQGQIRQQRDALAGIDKAIADQAAAFAVDPDRPLRERLQGVEVESARLSDGLRTMERGLVPPERVAPLLETMLRANGRLRLVSMKTLPVVPVNEALLTGSPAAAPAEPAAPVPPQAASSTAAPKPAAPQPAAPNLLFRHGVELTVRGSYLDLVDYMNTLEMLPTQLFWGKAQLEVEDYPSVRLTLTLYTLSLDTKWMKL